MAGPLELLQQTIFSVRRIEPSRRSKNVPLDPEYLRQVERFSGSSNLGDRAINGGESFIKLFRHRQALRQVARENRIQNLVSTRMQCFQATAEKLNSGFRRSAFD